MILPSKRYVDAVPFSSCSRYSAEMLDRKCEMVCRETRQGYKMNLRIIAQIRRDTAPKNIRNGCQDTSRVTGELDRMWIRYTARVRQGTFRVIRRESRRETEVQMPTGTYNGPHIDTQSRHVLYPPGSMSMTGIL